MKLTKNYKIKPFSDPDDFIDLRNKNSSKNISNNSTYVTRSENHTIQIYGKTYGANKYESTIFCVALNRIKNPEEHITLFQIIEGNLKELPERSKKIIEPLGIELISSNEELERKVISTDDNLRSPRYTYNLLVKLGLKKCAFCGCEIPEIIQGAHIWPVSSIKNDQTISKDKKIKYATDGDNGIWLCENHHKLFDEEIISIDQHGIIFQNKRFEDINVDYVNHTTPVRKLDENIFNKRFKCYLSKRYGQT